MNPNDPAFPFPCQGPTGCEIYYGLTKRELFAAMMMQALVTDGRVPGGKDIVAKVAAYYADALLAELEKNP